LGRCVGNVFLCKEVRHEEEKMITSELLAMIRNLYFRDVLTIREISAILRLRRDVVARMVARIRREGRYDHQ
jgi:DNA-binding transcriptional regulator LsrR (DeoR family)